jgi:hypothetical protein
VRRVLIGLGILLVFAILGPDTTKEILLTVWDLLKEAGTGIGEFVKEMRETVNDPA